MHRRQFATAAIAVVALFQVLAPLQATAQISGSSYVSPSYGYSLNYDPSWAVAEESSTTGVDFLKLGNGVSSLTVMGYQGADGDAAACVEGAAAWLTSSEGGQITDLTTISSNGDVASAFGVYSYSEEAGKAVIPMDVIVGCLSLVPGEAVLEVMHFAPQEVFEEEFAAVEPILQSIALGPSDGLTNDAMGTETGSTLPSGKSTVAIAPEMAEFIDFVVAELDAYWTVQFQGAEVAYQSPTDVVVFDQAIETECGLAMPAEIGSFYCPLDQTIYLDLSQLTDIEAESGSAAIAQALAHEWGHHIELLLGIVDPTSNQSIAWTLTGATTLETELMADCMSGGWVGAATRLGIFSPAHHDDMVHSLSIIGDTADTQYDNQHGNGALRVWWFLRGLNEGTNVCLSAL